jgi:putative aldouronate transport system permease protein
LKIKQTLTDRVFTTFVYVLLGLLCISFIIPILQVLTNSLSPPDVINSYGFHLIPTKFDLSGYKTVLQDDRIWTAYGYTIIRTLLGTSITVLLTFLGAYPLSKALLPNRKLWTSLIVVTMFFSGGMIPSYLLVKNLGMMNSMWALVLPAAISTYMLLVTRSFLAGLPDSLEESAKIDGANDILILFRIILPLSLPIIATVALYSAVSNWNAWFDAMIYIQDQKKQVLQIILRNILLVGTDPMLEQASSGNKLTVSAENLKMATLMVSILPILVVYPFLQKYFIKGALIGSIKG